MFLENALPPPRCFGIDPRRLVVGSGQSPDYIWLVVVDANKGVSRLLIPPPPEKKKRTRSPPPSSLRRAPVKMPAGFAPLQGLFLGTPFPPSCACLLVGGSDAAAATRTEVGDAALGRRKKDAPAVSA